MAARYRGLVARRGQPRSRSPLKAAPLRVAGQSVQDEIDRIVENELEDAALFMAIAFVVLVMAIFNYFVRTPPGVFVAVGALYMVGATAWGVPRIRRARKKLRRLRQGRDGERAVAEYLDTLRDDGIRVLHDLRGQGFNVDHVLVGPQGIYTIETKTLSKPTKGNPKVVYDGERIRIGSYEPSRDPVTQAKAEASWLRQLIQTSTGKAFTVRPVVVFPGWFVEEPNGIEPPVWVLEPKMLRARLLRQPLFMSDEDVSLCVFHLKRFIRGT